jgi:hypothetical protein
MVQGVGPTTARAAVLTGPCLPVLRSWLALLTLAVVRGGCAGSQLSSYDHTKRALLRTPYFKDDVTTHLLYALTARLPAPWVTFVSCCARLFAALLL